MADTVHAMWKRQARPSGPAPADREVEAGEAAFVRRLQDGDSAAWARFYDEHYEAIWRYAAVRTGSRDLADDVAAQVFLDAVRGIGRYRPQGKPIVAWLYGIARNQASKHVRRQRREPQAADIEPAYAGFEDGTLDTLALGRALRALTKDQRNVVALRYYAGRSTAEIAAALGKSEKAVYSLEARALAALKGQLAPGREDLAGREEFRPAPGIDT
jgi:RNA polymerase sigma-70 factor (ECF subfamily)